MFQSLDNLSGHIDMRCFAISLHNTRYCDPLEEDIAHLFSNKTNDMVRLVCMFGAAISRQTIETMTVEYEDSLSSRIWEFVDSPGG